MPRHNNREEVFTIRFGTHSTVREATRIAVDHKQAERIARTFPNVKSVAKANREYYRIADSEMRTMTNNIMKDIAKPKISPIAMDEFLWMRRTRRIENKSKDKVDIQ